MRRLELILICLALACGCAAPSLPVLEPPAPPPPPAASEGAPPQASPAPGRIVGSLPQLPPPRFAVAVFALPAGAAPLAEAPYSPEWTTQVLNRLDINKLSARALDAKGPLAGGLDAGTAALAGSQEAKSADVLISGTVLPGSTAQVRLLLHDTKYARLIGRAEFEGDLQGALDRAVEDAFEQVSRYWFELARGTLTSLLVEVSGFRTEPEIAAVQDAIAGLPGVKLTRHAGTVVGGGSAIASYQVTLEGSGEDLLGWIAEIRWTAAGKSVTLVKTGSAAFTADYDG